MEWKRKSVQIQIYTQDSPFKIMKRECIFFLKLRLFFILYLVPLSKTHFILSQKITLMFNYMHLNVYCWSLFVDYIYCHAFTVERYSWWHQRRGWGRRTRNDSASLTSVLGVHSEGPYSPLSRVLCTSFRWLLAICISPVRNFCSHPLSAFNLGVFSIVEL